MLSVGKQYEKFEYFATDPIYTVKDGQWLGGLAQELGFKEMSADTLSKLQAGQNAAGTQVVELSKKGEHNPGKDFVFTPDKALSVLRYSEATPQWFKDIYDKALLNAGKYGIETMVNMGMITTRDTIDGKQIHTPIKDVNQIVGYSFLHSLSRENDPNSHLHMIISNMTKIGGIFKAIKFDGLFTKGSRQMLDQGIKNMHISEIERLAGMDLKDIITIDKTTGQMQVKDLDKETLEKYSTRSQQINQNLEENGIARSAKSTQTACLATRVDKDFDFSKEQLEEKLRPENGKMENIAAEFEQRHNNFTPERTLTEAEKAELKQAVTTQISNLGKNEIYNNVNILIDQVLQENRHFLIQDVQKEIASRTGYGLELDVRTVTQNNREVQQFATYSNINSERFVQSFIKDGVGKGFTVNENSVEKGIKAFEKSKGFKLSDEQRNAINTLNSKDRCVIIQGKAGTGKTTVFSAVNTIMKNSNVNVIGLSNNGNGAQNLQRETGIPSMTTKSFIVRNQDGGKNTKEDRSKATLFVIDETSLSGVKDFEDTLKTIEKAGYTDFKIAMLGDNRQIQAIGAGNVLKNAVKTDAKQSILSDIRRQKNPELKKIILDYYDKLEKPGKDGKVDTRGIVDALKDKGFIRVVKAGEELKEAVKTYREQEKLGTTVLLTRTRLAMKTGNELIRAEKIKAGELSRTVHNLNVYEKKNMQETNRRRSENYEVGGILSHRSNEYNVITAVDHNKNTIDIKGLHTAVVGHNAKLLADNKISVTDKQGNSKEYDIKSRDGKFIIYYGKTETINLKTAEEVNTFQKYTEKNLELRKGDRVIFTQNVKGLNPQKETIKFKKTDNSKLYGTLKAIGAPGLYKPLKALNKVEDFVKVQINNHKVDKAAAKALANGDTINKEWSTGGNKGIIITHSTEIANNQTAVLVGKSGDNYIFKMDDTGEKLVLNSKDLKAQQALAVLDYAYALTTDRSQGATFDRATSVENARKTAEQNLVDNSRVKFDFKAVVSEKDVERKEENGKIQNSVLDNAFANVTEKTTSISDERTPDKSQDNELKQDTELKQDNDQSRDNNEQNKDNEQVRDVRETGQDNDQKQEIGSDKDNENSRDKDNEQSREVEQEREQELER